MYKKQKKNEGKGEKGYIQRQINVIHTDTDRQIEREKEKTEQRQKGYGVG